MKLITLSLLLLSSLTHKTFSFPQQQPDSTIKSAEIESLTLKCNFEITIYNAQNFYTCRALKFNNEDENGKVVEVVGEHLDGNSNSNVEALIMDGKLKFLPTNLNEIFKNLVRIEVTNSKLEKIKKDNFNGLNLEVLKLSKNRLKFIDSDALEGQQSLTKISLDRNKIENLPDEIFSYTTQLETLRLENNNLKVLSENLLQNLPNLKEFVISDNKIKKITAETFKNNKNLETLDVSNNKLKFIESQILVGLKNLKKINFGENECLKNLDENENYERDDLERMFETLCSDEGEKIV